MTTLSSSITKIRRLIRDENSRSLTSDTPILNLIGRVQQEFARDTLCLVKVKEMLAPPEILYAFTYAWEEGYLGESAIFRPFAGNSVYTVTQPFEASDDYDIDGQGYTITCGDDLCSVEAQHPVPFFPGSDYHRPQMLLWDYKVLDQKSYQSIRRDFDDGWHYRSDEVDYFSHVEGVAQKALVTRGIPYDKVETAARDMVGNSLRADVMLLCYKSIPDRPTVTTDSYEIQEPLVKYVEFGVASRLLRSYYALRDLERAAHFDFRYKLGVSLTKALLGKQSKRAKRRLDGVIGSTGGRPPHPRMPDHYPRLRLR